MAQKSKYVSGADIIELTDIVQPAQKKDAKQKIDFDGQLADLVSSKNGKSFNLDEPPELESLLADLGEDSDGPGARKRDASDAVAPETDERGAAGFDGLPDHLDAGDDLAGPPESGGAAAADAGSTDEVDALINGLDVPPNGKTAAPAAGPESGGAAEDLDSLLDSLFSSPAATQIAATTTGKTAEAGKAPAADAGGPAPSGPVAPAQPETGAPAAPAAGDPFAGEDLPDLDSLLAGLDEEVPGASSPAAPSPAAGTPAGESPAAADALPPDEGAVQAAPTASEAAPADAGPSDLAGEAEEPQAPPLDELDRLLSDLKPPESGEPLVARDDKAEIEAILDAALPSDPGESPEQDAPDGMTEGEAAGEAAEVDEAAPLPPDGEADAAAAAADVDAAPLLPLPDRAENEASAESPEAAAAGAPSGLPQPETPGEQEMSSIPPREASPECVADTCADEAGGEAEVLKNLDVLLADLPDETPPFPAEQDRPGEEASPATCASPALETRLELLEQSLLSLSGRLDGLEAVPQAPSGGDRSVVEDAVAQVRAEPDASGSPEDEALLTLAMKELEARVSRLEGLEARVAQLEDAATPETVPPASASPDPALVEAVAERVAEQLAESLPGRLREQVAALVADRVGAASGEQLLERLRTELEKDFAAAEQKAADATSFALVDMENRISALEGRLSAKWPNTAKLAEEVLDRLHGDIDRMAAESASRVLREEIAALMDGMKDL